MLIVTRNAGRKGRKGACPTFCFRDQKTPVARIPAYPSGVYQIEDV